MIMMLQTLSLIVMMRDVATKGPSDLLCLTCIIIIIIIINSSSMIIIMITTIAMILHVTASNDA